MEDSKQAKFEGSKGGGCSDDAPRNGNGKKEITRRKFLQILGSASAVGVAGCADRATQNIFPYVKGEDQQIPGVAVWYRSTCGECSAGCGIQVRTREGRAVKIEGNPESPINRGGLCALGQSALQSLYDPDRIRQPLSREAGSNGKPIFKPISWDEAYGRITEALKKADKKSAFIHGELSGAVEEITSSWCSAFNVERAAFDLMQPQAVAKACELTYGTYGVPTYSFEKAEVVLNFGADFLETWISPCEYARGWSKAKRAATPLRLIHVEPRLSLTGANADLWISAKPGTEVKLALGILKHLLDTGKGDNLSDDVLSRLKKLVGGFTIDTVAAETGVTRDKIVLIADYLRNAHSSLVIAGGSAVATGDPLPLLVITNFINSVLENVGQNKTVNIAAMRKPTSAPSKVATLVGAMSKGEVGLLFLYGTNPAFTFPSGYGFREAVHRVSAEGLVVSFGSHLDETAALANLILPSSTTLESWGDARPVAGVYSLMQPAMAPVFDTRTFGDMLLEIAQKGGQSSVGGGAHTLEEYLKSSWKKVQQAVGAQGDFGRFWLECVERGGYFEAGRGGEGVRINVKPEAYQVSLEAAKFETPDGTAKNDPILYPYVSVRSFDGRAANRPWLQELPDPISQAVWDSWAEIHPETARVHGLADGDIVQVRNHYGELNVPVYLTEYVHRDIVAVPIGQGHSNYGRYAQSVGGGNVMELLPPRSPEQLSKGGEGLPLLYTRVNLRRGLGRSDLVVVQGSNSQHGRELAQTAFIGAASGAASHAASEGEAEHSHEEHEHEHVAKQMYEQRESPLYRWGMAVDLAACTGCSACVVACFAENNIPVVGKKICDQGREMSWLRIERYYEGQPEELLVSFLPMMCQHCGNAPCEPVCPVYATYHNEDGLNTMVYNRCVGTRYCANNCSYKVRRFNLFEYDWPEPLSWEINPDVTKRGVGVMEKCTFCVQRITEARNRAKDEGRMIRDGEITPACVQSCPTEALVFGNLNDPNSRVSQASKGERAYKVLDHHLNTQPSVSYLKDVRYKV